MQLNPKMPLVFHALCLRSEHLPGSDSAVFEMTRGEVCQGEVLGSWLSRRPPCAKGQSSHNKAEFEKGGSVGLRSVLQLLEEVARRYRKKPSLFGDLEDRKNTFKCLQSP